MNLVTVEQFYVVGLISRDFKTRSKLFPGISIESNQFITIPNVRD